MKWFNQKELLLLHSKLTKSTGGDSGLRNINILDSVLNSPLQTFGGQDIYPGIVMKLARLSYCMACNHPFVDGNKRMGAYVLMTGLKMNKIQTEFTNEEIAATFLALASSKIEFNEFYLWVEYHIVEKE